MVNLDTVLFPFSPFSLTDNPMFKVQVVFCLFICFAVSVFLLSGGGHVLQVHLRSFVAVGRYTY